MNRREIRAWLTAHAGEWDAFAIVDDNSDMVDLHHMLVQTTWARGLLDEHVEALCELLGAPASTPATDPQPKSTAGT